MRDKYGVAQDKYCYPNSDVLINLLGIRDSDTLDEAEAEFTAERYRTYEPSQQTLCDFSFEHLKHLHHHLFQDLYAWAGETRDVDISKGDTRFCTWTRIEPEAQKLFRTVSALADYQDNDELIEKVADLFCELNLLHPFREGNGRVLRLLCTSKSGNTLEIYTPLSLGDFSRKSEKLQRNLDFSEVWKMVFQTWCFLFIRIAD